MLKIIAISLLPYLIFFGNSPSILLSGINQSTRQSNTGILEKMIVAGGSVEMDFDLSGSSPRGKSVKGAERTVLSFVAEPDSFFKVWVFNGELRGPLPSSLPIVPQNSAVLPPKLTASYQQLVLEYLPSGSDFELAIRDAKTGFVFFNIEGVNYDYDANRHLLGMNDGRLLLSPEFANELGRSKDAGSVVGRIAVQSNLRAIEVSEVVNGEVKSETLPSNGAPESGVVPGPDVIVGDLFNLQQFGSSGSQVGLAVGTTSCNAGTIDLNWFQNPVNDHPVIPQNLYRMSGGAGNDERFEQIGQSYVKHAFTALTENICNFGCNQVGGTRLGSGCSDPYSSGLNSGPNLGSRAWINPYTGVYPRNDSATPNNTHSGHTHTGVSHRILTEVSDLNTTTNAGATYYAEAQYITPHEYAWCQANPGQCNMFNNVSYRQYNVTGTTSFSFAPAAPTERTKPAINAWSGATIVQITPDPANDGVGFVAYKVTNPSPGVWHYEYAVYNQNMDRGIQSFSVPLSTGAGVSNIGFHAPPQHPGWTNDGTVGGAGFSGAAWTQTPAADSMTWNSETFAQNQNANAIRWGTTYNFRFDSNRPPQTANATVGFYKTGQPMTAQIMAPGAVSANVSVSGRVLANATRGVNAARVSITDSGGVSRTYITNLFGYYRFDGIPTGQNFTISVQAKRYSYAPQTLAVNSNLTGVDFTPLP